MTPKADLSLVSLSTYLATGNLAFLDAGAPCFVAIFSRALLYNNDLPGSAEAESRLGRSAKARGEMACFAPIGSRFAHRNSGIQICLVIQGFQSAFGNMTELAFNNA